MAFSAVSAVARILDQLLQHQSFILENREEVESLFKEVEDCSQKSCKIIGGASSLAVDAAYKARDLIETHIREEISRVHDLIFPSYDLLYEAVREINVVAVRLKVIDRGVPRKMTRPLSLGDYDMTLKIPDKGRLMFIVGVAGMGKTSLARQFFNQFRDYFEIRAWATVSESYDVKQILIDLLFSLGACPVPEEMMHQKTTQQLIEHLYSTLHGKSYLIVLDDLCDDIQLLDFFTQILPEDGETEGKILVTTRHENVAVSAEPSLLHRITTRWLNKCHRRLIQNSRKDAESLLKKVSLLRGIVFENSSTIRTEKRNTWENLFIDAEKRAKSFTESPVTEYNLTLSPECLMQVKGVIDLVNKLIAKIDNEEEEDDSEKLHCLPGAAQAEDKLAQELSKLTIKIDEEVENLHCLPGAAPAGSITAKDFREIKNNLAKLSSKLDIVSLVGMPGIGKTTLAKQVYGDRFFIKSFPIRAWVTISQSYDKQKVLMDLLDSVEKDGVKVDGKSTVGDLSQQLYKSLKGWTYLIVIDDIWDTKVWDDLRRLFPDDDRSSRILLTTRLKDVALHAKSSLHCVDFLNESESWNLFCIKALGEDSCPPQLEEIGKKIVRNCRGLPLAIVVIAGLLSRATRTKEYWEMVSRDLSLGGNDHCLQTISLSYTHLSDRMKKCFLYVGIFPEDCQITASELVKLWIAEGFLEPLSSNRIMEDIAYEVLEELVSRSLLLVGYRSSTGKIKRCQIHDLVRDFCTREAKREILLHITDRSLYGIPVDAKVPFLIIHPSTTNIIPCDDQKLSSLEVGSLHIFDENFYYSMHHLNREPLRVLNMRRKDYGSHKWAPDEILSYNLRFLWCDFNHTQSSILSSAMLPELQTLILPGYHSGLTVFPIIWNMTQLRHVKASKLSLSDPVEVENSRIVLENLRTLSQVYNFRWSKEVLGRIPNVKKLGIIYELEESTDWQHYCLENLSCLQKLESLTCTFSKPCPSLLHILSFPPSLKKLTLEGCGLPWEHMKVVGLLPNLEVLKLHYGSFVGEEWEWESTEEEFPKLKDLLLKSLDLEVWRADTVSLPRLQRLIIIYCKRLKEIPSCIGGIETLELIQLIQSTDSLKDSIKEIEKEQQEFGNDNLQVRIYS